MNRTVSAIVIAGMLGCAFTYAFRSAYADCSLNAGYCYWKPERCPQTGDFECHEDAQTGTWFRATKFYYHFVCQGVSSTFPKCDLDDGNLTHVCADVVVYPSAIECMHNINAIGTTTRVSAPVCDGSTACSN